MIASASGVGRPTDGDASLVTVAIVVLLVVLVGLLCAGLS